MMTTSIYSVENCRIHRPQKYITIPIYVGTEHVDKIKASRVNSPYRRCRQRLLHYVVCKLWSTYELWREKMLS